MNVLMRRLMIVLSMALGVGGASSVWASVSASLDREQVAAGETVQLTLQRDSSSDGQPDLGVLKRDFDVLGTSSGSSMQLVNGHFSHQVQFQISLAPKRSGRLTIPAIQWGDEQSQPLTVSVGAGAGGSNSGAAESQHVFMTSEVDDKQPYVQGAVVLTVQLHADETLRQAGLQMPDSSDVTIQQLGKDTQTTEVRNGRNYQLIERQYLLQPQRSGTLTLEGPVLDGQVIESRRSNDPFRDPFMNGMMGAVRPLRLHGDPIVLDVRPRPANVGGRDWLPAQHLVLEESWKPDGAKLHVGEPLTLHLRLEATGLTAAQLPDLSAQLALPDGLKAYPDQAKLENTVDDGKVVGHREQDIALIANRAGHYQIPELHLSWWNTRDNAPREIVLPAKELEILPAAGEVQSNPTPAQPLVLAQDTPPPAAGASAASAVATGLAGPTSRVPWPWISLTFALLWLGTLAAWVYTRRRGPSVPKATTFATGDQTDDPGARQAENAFRKACADNQPRAARQQLLAWAHARWPQARVAGLNALAERLQNEKVRELLRELDRACYAGGGEWRGAPLAQSLKHLPKADAGTLNPTGDANKRTTLAALYP
jgi:hypothetical protein